MTVRPLGLLPRLGRLRAHRSTTSAPATTSWAITDRQDTGGRTTKQGENAVNARHLALLAAVSVLACSNPKDATKSNFSRALQAYHDEAKACLRVDVRFPHEAEKGSSTLPVLQELAARGLLTANDTQKVVQQVALFGAPPTRKVDATAFALSDAGKAISREETGWTHSTAFCFGTPKGVEVTSFTEPADMMGVRISQVTYTYQVNDIADWADSETLRKHSRELARAVASKGTPAQNKAALVLMNDGWVHEEVAKRLR
jgi:hypothetical protein